MNNVMSFYSKRLNNFERELNGRSKARKVIREPEIQWVETYKDYRTRYLIGQAIGFATSGIVLTDTVVSPMRANGFCGHDEEVIFIVGGPGIVVVGDVQYPGGLGSAILFKWGHHYRIVNTVAATAHYISVLVAELEEDFGVQHLIQIEPKLPTGWELGLDKLPIADSGVRSDRNLVVVDRAGAENQDDSVGDRKTGVRLLTQQPEVDSVRRLELGNFDAMREQGIRHLHDKALRNHMHFRELVSSFDLKELEVRAS